MPNIDVIFSDGIRQDDDPRALPPSALRQARNCIIEADGSIEKRPGTDALPLTIGNGLGSPGSIATIERISSHSQELLVFSSGHVYTRNAGTNVFSDMDIVPNCMAMREDVLERNLTFDGGYDIGVTNTFIIYAYVPGTPGTNNTSVYATVVDRATGAKIVQDQLVSGHANVTSPRVLICGNTVVVVYGDNNGGNVYGAKMDLTAPYSGFAAEVNMAGKVGGIGTALFDATELVNDTANIAVATVTTLSPPTVTAAIYPVSSLIPSSSNTVAYNGTGTASGIACSSGNKVAGGITSYDRVWVVCAAELASGSSNVFTVPYSFSGGITPDIAAFDAVTTIPATGGQPVKLSVAINPRTVGSAAVLASGPVNPGITQSKWSVVEGGGTVTTSGFSLLNHDFVSRPATIGGALYAVAQGRQFFSFSVNAGYYDTAYHLVDLNLAATGGRLPIQHARLGPRITQQTTLHKKATNLYVNGNNMFSLGSVKSSGQVSGGRTALTRLEYDFSKTLSYQTVQLGGLTYISGGVPTIYDGSRVQEQGFEFSPSVSVVHTNTGGSIANGSYKYALIWEWFDDTGSVHRSAPVISNTEVVANGPSASITVTSNGLAITRKTSFSSPLNAPYLVPYRTLDLVSNPSSQYYRVPGDAPSSNQLTGEPGTSVSFVDTNSDATIQTHPTLYTTGGVLENESMPASQLICVHKNRIWSVGDDHTTLWFSKEAVPSEAPGFNDILTYPFPEGGRIYGLASLDDKLLVLKKQKLYVISGDGPSDTGTGYDYSRPFQVLSDVGCDNWRSVVTTPMGVFFANQQKGIFLCSRNLEVSWIGHRVENLFFQYPVVTSAVLHQNRRWVCFTCLSSETSTTGITLVYDLEHDRWTTWDHSTGAGNTRSAVSACVFNGAYTVALAEPKVLVWNQNTCRDNLVAIPFVVELGWQVNGVSGDMIVRRAQFHGESLSQHGLIVEFAREFSDTYDAPAKSITEQNIAAMSLERIRFGPKYQRCQAFSMKITEVASSLGNGKGCRLHGVTFVAEPLQGPYPRLSSGQQA